MFTYPIVSPGGAGGLLAVETVSGSTDALSTTLTFSNIGDATQCVPFVTAYTSGTALPNTNSNSLCFNVNVFDDAGTAKCTISRTNDPGNTVWNFTVTLVEFESSYNVTKYSGTYSGDSATTGYADITISSVDTSSAFAVGFADYSGVNSNIVNASSNRFARLTSATNARLEVSWQNGVNQNYSVYVVEDPSGNMQVETLYDSEVASSTWTSKDLTASSLDPTSCIVVGGGRTLDGAGYYAERGSISCVAVDSSTVRFTRPTGWAGASAEFRFMAQLVSIPNASVVHGSHTWVAADYTENKTIGTVDTDVSFASSLMPSCLFDATNDVAFSGAGTGPCMTEVELTGATTVTLNRGPTQGDAGLVGYQVISIT